MFFCSLQALSKREREREKREERREKREERERVTVNVCIAVLSS